MIRLATLKDLNDVTKIYEDIHYEEESGRAFVNWKRGVYPTIDTAIQAINSKEMFVMIENGAVVASAIINRKWIKEYDNVDWTINAPIDKIMVLHTLAVSPKSSGRGYGTTFVRFYEDYALKNKCPYLRMDTWEKNTVARSLYKKLGYNEAGTITVRFNGIEGFVLVCLEKALYNTENTPNTQKLQK
jgi:ribosomal protein S18 acetylase RimI-like enzyme